MIIRSAKPSDMPSVHLMAHDTWGGNRTTAEHVAYCLSSPKYAKGRWFVLEHEGEVKSALICYRNTFGLPENAIGIGSVATTPSQRRKGFASNLMQVVIAKYSEDEGVKAFFLYSDVSTAIYERLGFIVLPKELQRYKASVGMLRPVGISARSLLSGAFRPPDYF